MGICHSIMYHVRIKEVNSSMFMSFIKTHDDAGATAGKEAIRV